MPQVQKGQVQAGQNGAPQIYGTGAVENSLPFQERLMRRFAPQDYVVIENVTNETVYWQYLPSHAEEATFTEDGMQKMINRKTPELWEILPGEREVLVGASAYMCLDVMYKNYSAARILGVEGVSAKFDDEKKHVPKNFNFADGGAQENFINLAFKGKANPTFSVPQQAGEQIAETPLAPVDDHAPAKPARELVNAGNAKK